MLDDPDTAEREHDLPHIGTMSVERAIDMIYTGDVFLHRWDLARATGREPGGTPRRSAVAGGHVEPERERRLLVLQGLAGGEDGAAGLGLLEEPRFGARPPGGGPVTSSSAASS